MHKQSNNGRGEWKVQATLLHIEFQQENQRTSSRPRINLELFHNFIKHFEPMTHKSPLHNRWLQRRLCQHQKRRSSRICLNRGSADDWHRSCSPTTTTTWTTGDSQWLHPIHLDHLPLPVDSAPAATTPKHARPQPAQEGPQQKQIRTKAFPRAQGCEAPPEFTPQVGTPIPKGPPAVQQSWSLLSNRNKHLQHQHSGLHHLVQLHPVQLQSNFNKLFIRTKKQHIWRQFEWQSRTSSTLLSRAHRRRSHMSNRQQRSIGPSHFMDSFGRISKVLQLLASQRMSSACCARRFQCWRKTCFTTSSPTTNI